MATQTISVISDSAQSAVLTSTKVKVVSTVGCYYAVGINPTAYAAANCAYLPPNTIRDINVGPGQLNYTGNTNIIGNVTTGGTGPKIAFVRAAGDGAVNVTEIGYVNFAKVTN